MDTDKGANPELDADFSRLLELAEQRGPRRGKFTCPLTIRHRGEWAAGARWELELRLSPGGIFLGAGDTLAEAAAGALRFFDRYDGA